MDIENEIYEVWKELNPSEAYNQGLDEFAGRIFVPTKENCERVLAQIRDLMGKTDDEVQRKFLLSLQATVKFREAPHDLSEIIWTLFGHIVKEGINPQHISSLLDYSGQILENTAQMYDINELPLEIKVILVNKCNSLLGILKVIGNEIQKEELKGKIKELTERIKEYRESVAIEGIEKGDFSEVFPLLKRDSKGDLGRKDHYHKLIKELYDYFETPDEIEEKAMSWLVEELPRLLDITKELANIYGIEPDIDLMDIEVGKRTVVGKSELMDFIKSLREKAKEVMESRLVRVNPRYQTKVLKTPDYLVNFIPTAAMTMFDSLTDQPFNIFFVTTDEKRSPPTSVPDIFQLVIHEEYGHCVNFSNSAVGFEWKPNLVERLNSHLHYPISEGISFHREFESLELLEELVAKPKENLSFEEKEFLDVLARKTDIKTVFLESQFILFKWRIIRYLRAIGDVRINMNKQSLTEFVEWAAQKTGFSEKVIYDQLFIFQENPGYAPCYSIAGMALKEIQDEARKKGKDILKFNTVASSLGFPPRTVFEERLRKL